MTLCLPCSRLALHSPSFESPTPQSRPSHCTPPPQVSPHSLPPSRPISSQSRTAGSSVSLLRFSSSFRYLNKPRRGNPVRKQQYLSRRLIVVGTSRLLQQLSCLRIRQAIKNRHSAPYLRRSSNTSLGNIDLHIQISGRLQFLYSQDRRVNTSFQIACQIPKNMFSPTGD